jgi:hypothetical protein
MPVRNESPDRFFVVRKTVRTEVTKLMCHR